VDPGEGDGRVLSPHPLVTGDRPGEHMPGTRSVIDTIRGIPGPCSCLVLASRPAGSISASQSGAGEACWPPRGSGMGDTGNPLYPLPERITTRTSPVDRRGAPLP
jgi:hypothetical protein